MQKADIDMVDGPLIKGIFKFTMPLMASSFIQLLFNASDIAVVGHFGSEHSLAAVGSVTALVTLLVNFFTAFTIGVNVLTSLSFGQRNFHFVYLIVHTSMALALAGGFLFTGLGLALSKTILEWMSTPAEVLPLSALYTRIYFCGMIPVAVYNFGASLLYAKGDTKRPFYFLVIAGILNIILNLIFVICFHMDVAGVALATVLAQCLSAFLIVRYLMKQKNCFRLFPLAIRFDKVVLSRILKIGFPAGLQSVIFNLSNMVIQGAVNTFGPVYMAGSAAAQNIECFIWISMSSFQSTITTFTSHNIGAKNYKRITPIKWIIIGCEASFGIVLGTLAVLFGPTLLKIYTTNPEAIEPAMMRMHMVAAPYALCGIMDALSGALRGMGTTLIPMIVCLICACGLRIVWIMTFFQMPEYHTFHGLFFSYPLSWAVAFIVLHICSVRVRKRFPKE